MENVSLVKEPTKPYVYFFCGGTKFPIPSQEEFDAAGFEQRGIKIVPEGTLDAIPEKPFVAPPSVKPSDVFFTPPCPPDILGLRTTCHPASSIVARNIMLAGWLKVRYINSGIFRGDGIEDVLYDISLDVEFIARMYGPGGLSRSLAGTFLPGNPSYLDDDEVGQLQVEDVSETGGRRGVTINSVVVPRPHPEGDVDPFRISEGGYAHIHCELNCWHENGNGKVQGRGPHPEGWKPVKLTPDPSDEDPAPTVEYKDCWFPYDPRNPDGSGDLKAGDYVILKGTLYEDNEHDENCWSYGPTRGHSGWLEIHPIDWIMRPAIAPSIRERQTAFVVNVCAPAGSPPMRVVNRIRPDFDSEGKHLEASEVRELIDSRFTDMNSVVHHNITAGTIEPESPHQCPHLDVAVGGPGRPPARFKAAYIVSWREKLNGAAFVHQDVPWEMDAGGNYDVRVVMRNTGTKTWTPDGQERYRLGSLDPELNNRWGLSQVDLPHPVTPGSDATFDFRVTAPSVRGSVIWRWGMLREAAAGGVAFFSQFPNPREILVGGVVEVPEVVHWRRGQAVERILSVGLDPEITVNSSQDPNAWVSSQSPPPGTVVDPASTVTLVLRGGEPPVA